MEQHFNGYGVNDGLDRASSPQSSVETDDWAALFAGLAA